MDIGKMDIKDLKALAYDEICNLEIAQKNLTVINRAITEKSGAAVVPVSDLVVNETEEIEKTDEN